MKACGYSNKLNIDILQDDYNDIHNVYTSYNLQLENVNNKRLDKIINNKSWNERQYHAMLFLKNYFGRYVNNEYIYNNATKTVDELLRNKTKEFAEDIYLVFDSNLKIHKPISELKLYELLYLMSYNEGDILSTENKVFNNRQYVAQYNPDGKYLYVSNGSVKLAYEDLKDKFDIKVIIYSNYNNEPKIFEPIDRTKYENIKSNFLELKRFPDVINAIYDLPDLMESEEYELLDEISEKIYNDIFQNLNDNKKLYVLLHYLNILFLNPHINVGNYQYIINEFKFAGVYDIDDIISYIKFANKITDLESFLRDNEYLLYRFKEKTQEFVHKITKDAISIPIAFDTRLNTHIAIIDENIKESIRYAIYNKLNEDNIYVRYKNTIKEILELKDGDKFTGIVLDLLDKLNIDVNIVEHDRLISIIQNLGYQYVGQKAFYFNGAIYLSSNIDSKTLLHEVLHPFLLSYLHYNNEALDEIFDILSLNFTDVLKRYNKLRQYYNNDRLAKEEVIVEILTDVIYKKYNDERGIIQKILDKILEFIRNVFGIKSKITLESTVADIIKFIESENKDYYIPYDDLVRFDIKLDSMSLLNSNIHLWQHYRSTNPTFLKLFNKLYVDTFFISNHPDIHKKLKWGSKDLWNNLESLGELIKQFSDDVTNFASGKILIPRTYSFDDFFAFDKVSYEYFEAMNFYNTELHYLFANIEKMINTFAKSKPSKNIDFSELFMKHLFSNSVNSIPIFYSLAYNISLLTHQISDILSKAEIEKPTLLNDNVIHPVVANTLMLEVLLTRINTVYHTFNGILDKIDVSVSPELQKSILRLKGIFKELHDKVVTEINNSLYKNSNLLRELFIDFLSNSYSFIYEDVIRRFDEVKNSLLSNNVENINTDELSKTKELFKAIVEFWQVLTQKEHGGLYVFGQLKKEELEFFDSIIKKIENNNKIIGEKLYISDDDKERFLLILKKMANAGVITNRNILSLYVTNNFSNDHIRAILSSFDNNNIIITAFTRFFKTHEVANKSLLTKETKSLYEIIERHNLVGANSNIGNLLTVEQKPIIVIGENNLKKTTTQNVYTFKSLHKNYLRRYSILKSEIEEQLKRISNIKVKLNEKEITLFNMSISNGEYVEYMNEKAKSILSEVVVNYVHKLLLEKHDESIEALKTNLSNVFISLRNEELEFAYMYLEFLHSTDIDLYFKYLQKNNLKKYEELKELYTEFLNEYEILSEKEDEISKFYSKQIDDDQKKQLELKYYIDALNEIFAYYKENILITENQLKDILEKKYNEMNELEKRIYDEYMKLKRNIENKVFECDILFSKLKTIETIINNIYEQKIDLNPVDADQITAERIDLIKEEYRILLRNMLSYFEDKFINKVEDITTNLFRNIFELNSPRAKDYIFNEERFVREVFDALEANNYFSNYSVNRVSSLSLNEILLIMEVLESRMRIKHKKDSVTGENLYYKTVTENYERLYDFYKRIGIPEEKLNKIYELKEAALKKQKEINSIGFIDESLEFSVTGTHELLNDLLEELNEIHEQLSEELNKIDKTIPSVHKKEHQKLKDEIFKLNNKRLKPSVVIAMIKNFIAMDNNLNKSFYNFVQKNTNDLEDIVYSLIMLSAFFDFNIDNTPHVLSTIELEGQSILNRDIYMEFADRRYKIHIKENEYMGVKNYEVSVTYVNANGFTKTYTINLNKFVYSQLGLRNKAYLRHKERLQNRTEETYGVRISNALMYIIPSKDTSYILNTSIFHRMPSVKNIAERFFSGYAPGNRYTNKVYDKSKITPKIIGLTVDSNNNFLPRVFENKIFVLLLGWMYNNMSYIENKKTAESVKKYIDSVMSERKVNNVEDLNESDAIEIVNSIYHLYPPSVFFMFLKDFHLFERTNSLSYILDKKYIDSGFFNTDFYKDFISKDKKKREEIQALLDLIIWFIDFQHKLVRTSGMLYLEYPRYNIKMSEIFTKMDKNPVSPFAKLFGWLYLMMGIDNTDESFGMVYRTHEGGMYNIGLTHLPLYGHHNNPIERTSTNVYSLYTYISNVLHHNTLMNTLPMALTYSYIYGLDDIISDYKYKKSSLLEDNPYAKLLPNLKSSNTLKYILESMFKKYYLGVRYFERKNFFLKALMRSMSRMLVYTAFSVASIGDIIRVISNYLAQQITTNVRLASFSSRMKFGTKEVFSKFITAIRESRRAYRLKSLNDFSIKDIENMYILITLIGDQNLIDKFLFRGIRFSPKHPTSLINFMYVPKEASELFSRMYAYLLFAYNKNIEHDGNMYSIFDIIGINGEGVIYNKLKIPGYEIRFNRDEQKYVIGPLLLKWLFKAQNVITKSSLGFVGRYDSPLSEKWYMKIIAVMRTYVFPYLNEVTGVNRIDPDTGNIITPPLHYASSSNIKIFQKLPFLVSDFVIGIAKNIIFSLRSVLGFLYYLMIKPLSKIFTNYFSKKVKQKDIYQEAFADQLHYYTLPLIRIALMNLAFLVGYYITVSLFSVFDAGDDDDDDKGKDNIPDLTFSGISQLAHKLALDPNFSNVVIGGTKIAEMPAEKRAAYAYAYANAIMIYNSLMNNKVYRQFLEDYDMYYNADISYKHDDTYINLSDKISSLVPKSVYINNHDKLIDVIAKNIVERENLVGEKIDYSKIQKNAIDYYNKLMTNIYLLASNLYDESEANPKYYIKDKVNTSFYNSRIFTSKLLFRTVNQLSAYSNPLFEPDQIFNIFNNVSAYENIALIATKLLEGQYEKDDIRSVRGKNKVIQDIRERFMPFINTIHGIDPTPDIKTIREKGRYNLFYNIFDANNFSVVPDDSTLEKIKSLKQSMSD